MQQQFEVGQAVAWTTRDKEMRGKVFAVIPPYTDPVVHAGFKNVKNYRLNFSGKLRNHVTYLIWRKRTLGTKQDDLCWPKVAEIRPAPAPVEAVT